MGEEQKKKKSLKKSALVYQLELVKLDSLLEWSKANDSMLGLNQIIRIT